MRPSVNHPQPKRLSTRAASAALLLAVSTPVSAWEFEPLSKGKWRCALTHEAQGATWQVLYDPRAPEYALEITLDDATWPSAPAFFLEFTGGAAARLSTNRQSISQDRRTLTVTDSGFSNVLSGLGANTAASAVFGNRLERADLYGIKEPLADFVACPRPAVS